MTRQDDSVTAVDGMDDRVRVAGSGSIARIVTEARTRLGMSQEQLADRANVNVDSIRQIESGDGNPRFYTLLAVLDAMGLEIFSMRSEEDGERPSGGSDGQYGSLDLSGSTIVIGCRQSNIDFMAAVTKLTAGMSPLCVYTSDHEAKQRCWESGIMANLPKDDYGQFFPLPLERGSATYYDVDVLRGLMLDFLWLLNLLSETKLTNELMDELVSRHDEWVSNGATLLELIDGLEQYEPKCAETIEVGVDQWRNQTRLKDMARMFAGLMRAIKRSNPCIFDIFMEGSGDFRTPTVAIPPHGGMYIPEKLTEYTEDKYLKVMSRAAYAACIMRKLRAKGGDPLFIIDDAYEFLFSHTMTAAYRLNCVGSRPKVRMMEVFSSPEAAAQAVGRSIRENHVASVYIGQAKDGMALEEAATLIYDAGYYMNDTDRAETMKQALKRRIDELGRNEYLHVTFRSGREPQIDRIRIAPDDAG